LLRAAAREDVYGVCVGGILGHALCTGLAVLGGRFIATRISVRTVTLVMNGIGHFITAVDYFSWPAMMQMVNCVNSSGVTRDSCKKKTDTTDTLLLLPEDTV
jgi:hypothetical protein